MDEPSGKPVSQGATGWLWRRPRRWWMFGIPAGALIAFALGALGVTGFISSVELSSSETFCVSCHEMRDNVYAEYQHTIHYSNPAGVRATCPDCHVPKAWVPKLLRKIQATLNEVPGHFLGTIDTPEKFRAKRQELAEDVWRSMRATDSRECRNCHALEHMDLAAQSRSAQRKHTADYQREHGKTCIDCHQGIAHQLPGDDKTSTDES